MYAMSEMNFECKRCGKCCRNRGDVLLTPMDVFHIAKFKNIDCKDVVERFAQIRTSVGDKFPRLVVRARDPKMTCVFYDNKVGCTIYPVRPIPCILFPLRAVSIDRFSVQQCKGVDSGNDENKVIISDWIKEVCPRYESEKEIQMLFINYSSKLEILYPDMNKEQKEEVKKLVYCDYDLSKDMEAQIRENMEKILEILL